MADAYRDGNMVPALIVSSSSDGKTPVRLFADPTTHRLLVSVGGTVVATTWGNGGNTSTITDANCSATSFIVIMHTGIPAGFWKIAPGAGSFVITSSDGENSSLSFSYKILA